MEKVRGKQEETYGNESEGSKGEINENLVGRFGSARTSERTKSHFQRLDNAYFSSNEDKYYIKEESCQESSKAYSSLEPPCRDKMQQEQEGKPKGNECENILAREANAESQSKIQDRRCRYLYDRNPLQDPRFTRLVEQLIPLRTSLSLDRTRMLETDRNANNRSDSICFKDICLNETCRLVFKIMIREEDNCPKD